MSFKALDRFGEFLMNSVRDEAISDWKMILDGRMKGIKAERVRSIVKQYDTEVINKIIPEIVDTVLHHLLWSIEREEDIEITVNSKDGSRINLSEVSDGLAGELYSDDGWIAKFSKDDIIK